MASQPASGAIYTVIQGGVGTTVLSPNETVLRGVMWGGTFVGSIELYDSATAAGTAAGNKVWAMGIPLLKYPESLSFGDNGITMRNGITYVATGTPVVTVIWGS